MDIGTAKPTPRRWRACPHHLIDLITPEEPIRPRSFCADALRVLMADIMPRGRIPLLVGGTMLYIKALREGLADLPQADAALRADIDAGAAARGWPALHAELAAARSRDGARGSSPPMPSASSARWKSCA
jgi:tRNA dimethylallyltransferase